MELIIRLNIGYNPYVIAIVIYAASMIITLVIIIRFCIIETITRCSKPSIAASVRSSPIVMN